MFKLLFISTPVGPLGTGLGGGVELSVKNIAQEMLRRGHTLQIVAPFGSVLGTLPIVQIAGKYQLTAQTQGRDAAIILPENAALANLWDYAREVQNDWDLIVNFAYDWLPFYLTPFFQRRVAHLVSMGSLSDEMDRIIGRVAMQFPGTIGVYSLAQAATFPFAESCRCLGSAIDLSLYDFCEEPQSSLAWLGRISPEKGLEDAVAAANRTGVRLKVMGVMQDEAYWKRVCEAFPSAKIDYLGFLSTDELQQQLRQCRALLMTPRWVEAFGNVAIEALACGVPVISYRRGGPTEIVRDGETGFLVEPDSVDGLIEAIGKLDTINRQDCRARAEAEYSLEALGDRFDAWFGDIVN
jgi:UDP-glucose:tetrahydrobiopterin glucosyltransferase